MHLTAPTLGGVARRHATSQPDASGDSPWRSTVWPELRAFVIQIILVTGAALLYFGVRGITEGAESLAVANGHDILAFEQRAGLAIEDTVQSWIIDSHWLTTLANWVYIWGHWPVIGSALAWLYLRRRGTYLLLRDSMFVSGAIGLVIFALYPVAPPRLLDVGLVDTVTEMSRSYRVLQPPALVNKFAAMPSLHVGWNMLVGMALWRSTRNGVVRAFGVLSPLAMTAAVVLTANHYLVDAFVGAAVAFIGLVAAWRLYPLLHRGDEPGAPESAAA